jgi:dienelactone hydrolase
VLIMTTTRSVLLGTALAVVASLAGAAAPASAAPDRLSLPPPTGRHQVGVQFVHLVDRSRPDPWVSSPPHRELMVSVYYPARRTEGHRTAPYMLPKAAAHFGAVDANQYLYLKVPADVDWAGVRTHAALGAPVDRRGGRLPVVLYSPGLGEPRTFATTQVEDLASRGYAVITIDNTYESPEVQFPDGSLRVLDFPADPEAWIHKVVPVRVADTRFVLDTVTSGHGLPRALAGALDPHRIGMWGHSAGGNTAAETMYEDRRIKAGVNVDGELNMSFADPAADLLPAAQHGLDRPFLLLGSDGGDSVTSDPSWAAFWAHRRGWVRDVTMVGSRHHSFDDAEALIPQIDRRTPLPPGARTDDIGDIDPARALAAQETYLAAFFDRFLRGRHDNHLLDGPSPRWPDMVFVP